MNIRSLNITKEPYICFIKNPKHPGLVNKKAWCKNRLKDGLVQKGLYKKDEIIGFIEYAPEKWFQTS